MTYPQVIHRALQHCSTWNIDFSGHWEATLPQIGLKMIELILILMVHARALDACPTR
jgi:hypothetical protein